MKIHPILTSERIEILSRHRVSESVKWTKNEDVTVEPPRLTDEQKLATSTGSSAESQELDKLYGALHRQISVVRIDRSLGRIRAVWNATDGCVHVVRKSGNMSFFGETRTGNLCLENFEAMFLLELGRLHLEYNDLVVSVEQGYLLLLGEPVSPAYNDYLLYSNLSRSGYILHRYKNVQYNKRDEPSAECCAWALLLHDVMKKRIPTSIEMSPLFTNAKEAASKIKTRIIQQRHQEKDEPPSDINFNVKINASGKRKAHGLKAWAAQKPRHIESGTSNSFVDILKSESEYEKLRSVFERFDIVHLLPREEISNTFAEFRTDNCTPLRIGFDIYIHDGSFKRRSNEAPHFRLIVLDQCQSFPAHSEVRKCYHQQLQPVPLLVTSIGESKQLQAYLYYFT